MNKDLRIRELEKELERTRQYIKNQNDSAESRAEAPSSFDTVNIFSFNNPIFENIHTPLILLDTNLKVLTANEAFYTTFKVDKSAIQNLPLNKLGNNQLDIPELRSKLEKLISSQKKLIDFEVHHDFENIGEKYMCLNAKEINLPNQSETFILLAVEDITKRKKAEIELKVSERRFHEMFYSSTSLLAIFKGPNHIIEIANDAVKKVWGKGEDVIGKPLLEVLPELEGQGFREILDKVYNTGEIFKASELPVNLHANGKLETRFFDFTFQPQRNAQGEIVGIADIGSDVTKQALLNQKIKKSEREFRKLIDFMPHKISVGDSEGNPLFYNKSWLDYVGWDMDKFLETHWTSITHPDDQLKIEKELEKCLKNGCDLELEIRILDKNHEYKWHLCRAIAVKDENNKVSKWISSSTQIQKIKEEEQQKEDFLKLVSHELKTPVTSIKGYIQLIGSILENDLKNSGPDIPIKPYLHRIEDQVESLIRLISEMLDLSRIEQNELEFKKDKFLINNLVENIIEDISYTHKDIQIKLEHLDECEVIADKDRVGQVIINFITNALKYSPNEKKIDVKIYEEGDNVAVSVKDYGIGIAKKDLKQIFKRFYRVAEHNGDTYSGFGIGLYLSNEIIERHDGEIITKSELGKGSEFIFTLPLN